MTFLQYSTFPSDAVLALTTAHVTLQCCDRNGELSTMSIDEFITTDYNEFVYTKGMFLVSLIIIESKTHMVSHASHTMQLSSQYLPVNQDIIAITYKIAQRSTNAHAHVNAGFQFTVGGEKS